MVKNKIFFWVLRVILLLSLFSFVISIYQLYYSNNKALNTSIKEWKEKKETPVMESPISSFQINHQQSNDPIYQENTEASIVEQQQQLYSSRPNKGEVIGKIIIPKIKKELPIIEGTDEKELAKGVGHYIGSVLPGEADNTVLAGHRDTVFKELGKVGVGDIVEVETEAGRFTYKIANQRIVHQDDRTVIVPFDYAALTLITCYPFNFVGPAPDRFILVGQLIEE